MSLLKKCIIVLFGCFASLFISIQVFAAEVASLSFQEQSDNIEVIAKFDTAGLKILSQGVLMAETNGELTLETQGRERISFTSLDSDGTCVFTVQATEKMKRTTFRAFLVVSGADGTEKVFYSEQNTPAKYLDYNAAFTVDNIRYQRIENGFEVLGVVNQTATLTVPESVKGEKVIKIAEKAFENDTVLTEIDLPDTIQIIGKRAFAGCKSLKTMK